jgi:hypothetical protein
VIVFALTHTHMDVPTRENGQVMAEWFHKVGCQWTVLLVSVLTARFTTSSLLHPINVWLYGGHKMALVHCKKRDKYPGNSSLSLLDPQSSSLYMPLSSNLTSPECQKLYPILSCLLTTQPAKTGDPILWCHHHLNYWRQNEVPLESDCKVCH